jgi:hypothetical protein
MTSNSDAVLLSLAQEINNHDEARRACEVKGIMHACRIGQLLIEAKKVVLHGRFLDWVKEHTAVTPRMCQIYMKIARSEHLTWRIEHEYGASWPCANTTVSKGKASLSPSFPLCPISATPAATRTPLSLQFGLGSQPSATRRSASLHSTHWRER